MVMRLRGAGGAMSSDEDSESNDKGDDVRHSTPKVSALRAQVGRSEDTTVEEGEYQDMTTTESGNTIVFKSNGEGERGEGSEHNLSGDEESEMGVFNVSPTDDKSSSEDEGKDEENGKE